MMKRRKFDDVEDIEFSAALDEFLTIYDQKTGRALELLESKVKKYVVHTDGPFRDILPGDLLRVVYHGAPTALMRVTRVKQHALIGHEGGIACKVTKVGDRELRFYAELGPNRQTVLRDVKLAKVKG